MFDKPTEGKQVRIRESLPLAVNPVRGVVSQKIGAVDTYSLLEKHGLFVVGLSALGFGEARLEFDLIDEDRFRVQLNALAVCQDHIEGRRGATFELLAESV